MLCINVADSTPLVTHTVHRSISRLSVNFCWPIFINTRQMARQFTWHPKFPFIKLEMHHKPLVSVANFTSRICLLHGPWPHMMGQWPSLACSPAWPMAQPMARPMAQLGPWAMVSWTHSPWFTGWDTGPAHKPTAHGLWPKAMAMAQGLWAHVGPSLANGPGHKLFQWPSP